MTYKYLIIERTPHGWRIKDDTTGAAVHYVGYTARDAERAFRIEYNLKYKHFTKIYI